MELDYFYFPVCGMTWHYFYPSLSYKNTAASFLYPPFSIEKYSRESHQFCFNLTCLCRGKKNGQWTSQGKFWPRSVLSPCTSGHNIAITTFYIAEFNMVQTFRHRVEWFRMMVNDVGWRRTKIDCHNMLNSTDNLEDCWMEMLLLFSFSFYKSGPH